MATSSQPDVDHLRVAVDHLDGESVRQLLKQVIDRPEGRSLLSSSLGAGEVRTSDQGYQEVDTVVPPREPRTAVGSERQSDADAEIHERLFADVAALGESAPATNLVAGWLGSQAGSADMSPALRESVEAVHDLANLRLSLRQLQCAPLPSPAITIGGG
eukprot:COSAG01_NODE_23217_length_823_cov_1.979282_2_plen_159_part_00